MYIPSTHYSGKNFWLIKAMNLNRGLAIKIIDSVEACENIIRYYYQGGIYKNVLDSEKMKEEENKDTNKKVYFELPKIYKNGQNNNFKNNHEFLPFPSLTQQYKKTDEKFKNKKKFENKKSNFNIIYLNLSNKNNKENEEYSVEQIEKNEFVNKKIEEINISKKQKIKEIFNKNEKIKIKNDLSMINKIPIVIINIFAEDIYNNMKNQKNQIKIDSNNISKSLNSKNNLDSKKNLLDFDNINKTIYKNNTFFQYVLDNVRHKVELINESNKSITMLYVMNLINKEISDLKKMSKICYWKVIIKIQVII